MSSENEINENNEIVGKVNVTNQDDNNETDNNTFGNYVVNNVNDKTLFFQKQQAKIDSAGNAVAGLVVGQLIATGLASTGVGAPVAAALATVLYIASQLALIYLNNLHLTGVLLDTMNITQNCFLIFELIEKENIIFELYFYHKKNGNLPDDFFQAISSKGKDKLIEQKRNNIIPQEEQQKPLLELQNKLINLLNELTELDKQKTIETSQEQPDGAENKTGGNESQPDETDNQIYETQNQTQEPPSKTNEQINQYIIEKTNLFKNTKDELEKLKKESQNKNSIQLNPDIISRIDNKLSVLTKCLFEVSPNSSILVLHNDPTIPSYSPIKALIDKEFETRNLAKKEEINEQNNSYTDLNKRKEELLQQSLENKKKYEDNKLENNKNNFFSRNLKNASNFSRNLKNNISNSIQSKYNNTRYTYRNLSFKNAANSLTRKVGKVTRGIMRTFNSAYIQSIIIKELTILMGYFTLLKAQHDESIQNYQRRYNNKNDADWNKLWETIENMPEYQNYLYPPSPSTTAKEVLTIETSQEEVDKILEGLNNVNLNENTNENGQTGGRRKKRTIKKYKKYKNKK